MNNLTPVYDSKEGINSFLSNLEKLNILKKLRHDAYYTRGERLNRFIILGKFYLDDCGNFSIIIKENKRNIIPYEYISNIDSVMYYEECLKLLPENSFICSTLYDLPPNYVKCSICDEFFNIKNCHEVISESKHIKYLLNKFCGKKFNDIKQLPEYINKTRHYIIKDYVCNKNYINRDGGNEKGAKNVNKDYIIQLDDEACVDLYNFMHSSCNRYNIIQTSLDKFKLLIEESYDLIQDKTINYTINSIENKYCSCDKCPPWYIVKIENISSIIIGWRKSVINIDWSKSGYNLEYLFENEEVTKGPCFIHAHGYDKAKEYLNKIIEKLRELS